MDSQPYQLLSDTFVESRLKEYNPYGFPPNLEQCIIHQKAKKMGIVKPEDLQGEVCPCCKFPTKKTNLKMCSRIKDYHSIGIGYEFFFIYMKFLILLLIIVFAITGVYDLNIMIKTCAYSFSCYENYLYDERIELTDRDAQMLLDMGAVIFSCFYIGYMRVYFKILERQQEYKVMPSHYALLIKNVTPSASKTDIQTFFEKYRLRRLDRVVKLEEIIFLFKINKLMRNKETVEDMKIQMRRIERDIKESVDNVRERIKLEDKKKKLKIKLDLRKAEIWQYNRQIESKEYEDMRSDKVILIFQDRSVAKQIEREFSLNILQEYFYATCSFFTCCSKKRIKGYRVVAEKIPEPFDINFNNLERGLLNKFLRRSFTNLFSLGLIVGSFIGIISLSKLQHTTSKDVSLKIDAFMLSLGLVAINIVVGIIITFLGNFESRSSFTTLNESIALKLSIVLFFNVSSVPFYLLIEPKIFKSKSDYSYSDLIINVVYMFLSNAIIAPLVLYFDPAYMIQRLRRLFIRCRGKKSKTYQFEANLIFQEPDFSISEKYALVNRTVLTAVFYSDILPYGTVVLLIGLILTFWISKYLLLNRTSMTYSIGTTLNRKMMNIIAFVPSIITGGFVLNSLQMGYTYTSVGWISLFFSIFFSFVTLFISKLLKNIPYFKKQLQNKNSNKKKLPYEEVKNQFFPNYSHFAPFYDQVNLQERIENNKAGDFKSMKHISLIEDPKKKSLSKSGDNMTQLKVNYDLVGLYVDQVQEPAQRRDSLIKSVNLTNNNNSNPAQSTINNNPGDPHRLQPSESNEVSYDNYILL